MKRSPNSTPSPLSSPLITPKSELDDNYSPSHSPSPIKPKSQLKLKASPTPSPAKRQRSTPTSTSAKAQGPWSAGWNPDKKEAIIERYLSLGIKASNIGDIAQEVGYWMRSEVRSMVYDQFNLTKAQLQNAIQTGHKNNLRDKAAKSVR